MGTPHAAKISTESFLRPENSWIIRPSYGQVYRVRSPAIPNKSSQNRLGNNSAEPDTIVKKRSKRDSE